MSRYLKNRAMADEMLKAFADKKNKDEQALAALVKVEPPPEEKAITNIIKLDNGEAGAVKPFNFLNLVFDFIKAHPNKIASEIAQRLGADPSRVSTACSTLAKNKLINGSKCFLPDIGSSMRMIKRYKVIVDKYIPCPDYDEVEKVEKSSSVVSKVIEIPEQHNTATETWLKLTEIEMSNKILTPAVTASVIKDEKNKNVKRAEEQIFDYLKDNPNTPAMIIAEELNISWKSVTARLAVMKQHELVSTTSVINVKTGKAHSIYSTVGEYKQTTQTAVKAVSTSSDKFDQPKAIVQPEITMPTKIIDLATSQDSPMDKTKEDDQIRQRMEAFVDDLKIRELRILQDVIKRVLNN